MIFRIKTNSPYLRLRLGPGPWQATLVEEFGPDSWQGSPDVRALAFRRRLVEDRDVALEERAYVVRVGAVELLVFATELGT